MTKAEAKKVRIGDYLYNLHYRRLEEVTDIEWTGSGRVGGRFPLFHTVCAEQSDHLESEGSSSTTYLLFKFRGE